MGQAESTDSTPLVSIGMPVYGEAMHVAEALESLLSQDYPSYEIIISDNCSVDRTRAICESFAAKDSRIRFFANDCNRGAGWNFQNVLDKARGSYFMWASGHDRWEPSCISACVSTLEQDPHAVLAFPLADWLDSEGRRLGPVDCGLDTRGLDQISRAQVTLWGMRYAYVIYGLLRTETIRNARAGNIGLPFGPDVAMLFELSLMGTFALVPKTLLHMRQLADFGDWDAYLRKLVPTAATDVSMRRAAFSSLVQAHMAAIDRRVPQRHARACLRASVRRCLWGEKYRPHREMFLGMSRQEKCWQLQSEAIELARNGDRLRAFSFFTRAMLAFPASIFHRRTGGCLKRLLCGAHL